jgi:HlyD family secretion protein
MRRHPSARRGSTPVRVLASAALLAACGGAGDDGLRATGTLEARETDVAVLATGRLAELRVREGDAVEVGDTVARLSRRELPGEMAAAQARVGAARARLAQLEAGSRAEDVAAARAALAGAEAEVEQAGRDVQRVHELAERELTTLELRERAETQLRRARSTRDAAYETLRRLQRGARPEEIEAARADVGAVEAQLDQVRAGADELVLLSPARGVVAHRNFEPGEVVGAGMPVVTLLDPRDLWIRVYVGQRALARLRIGQEAEVVADAVPDRRVPARIIEISPRAEFTPRVALTEAEREDVVFAVRLAVDDTSGVLKRGMSARALFRTEP